MRASGTVAHTFRPFCFAYIKAESNRTLRDLVMPALLALVRGNHTDTPLLTADCVCQI